MNSSNKQVALITGAARRIGAAIARHLHSLGYTIAIHYNHSHNDATLLATELNQTRKNSTYIFPADLQIFAERTKLISEIIQSFGRLDLLVNNASLFIDDVGAEKEHVWQQLFTVNVRAPQHLTKIAAQFLAINHGNVINITDIHASKPLKNYAIYCQTKAALALQTLSFAKELAPNIRVNAIAPGAIMWPEADNELAASQQQKIITKTPLACHGSPEFIAAAVEALLKNKFMTGQTLVVDGGRSIT